MQAAMKRIMLHRKTAGFLQISCFMLLTNALHTPSLIVDHAFSVTYKSTVHPNPGTSVAVSQPSASVKPGTVGSPMRSR